MQNIIYMEIDLKKELYRFEKAQQEDDVILDINLFENGMAKDLTGATIELIYINANNTVANVTGASVVISANNVKITCPRDCTRSSGLAKFQLKIISSNKQISTFPIGLVIAPGVNQGQAVSQNISTILEELRAMNVTANETIESLNAWVNEHSSIVDLDNRVKNNTSQLADIETKTIDIKRPIYSLNSIKTPVPMVTFLDDDGTRGVLTRLKPLAIEKKIPFTLAIISDKMESLNGDITFMGLNEVKDLYYNFGFEIQSHGKSHQAIANINDENQLKEIKGSYEKLNSLGFDVEYLIYPYGSNDRTVREKTSKYYKGAIGTDSGLNKIPVRTFNLRRVPIGLGAVNGQNTLDYYKSQVDLAIANNEWLIFMLHSGDPSHTTEQQEYLSNLIDYVKTTSIKITTIKEGYKIIGNLIDLGDYTDDNYKYFTSLGTTNMVNTDFKPDDWIKATTLPNDTRFTRNKVYYTWIAGDLSGLPENAPGLMVTTIPFNPAYAFQTFIVSSPSPNTTSRIYSRNVKYDLTGWNSWFKYLLTDSTTKALNIGSIQPGTSKSINFDVNYLTATQQVIITPNFKLPDGIVYSAYYNADWQARLTIFNSTTSSVDLGNQNWKATRIF